jgi:hypothetical protein
VWVRVEATREDPLIDLRVLRQRAVAATNLTGLLVGFAMFASFLLIPQFAQAPESTGYGFALTVTQAGLLIAPAAFVQLLVGPVVGALGTRFGFRSTLALGGALAMVSFALLAVQHSHPFDFVVSGALLGGGISLALASMANLIVDAVRQSEVGITVGAASGGPDPGRVAAEWLADLPWLLHERSREKLDHHPGNRLGQHVGQRSASRRGEDEFVLLAVAQRRRSRTAAMPRSTSPRAYATSASRMSARALASLTADTVSSSCARSSGLISTAASRPLRMMLTRS